MFKSLRSRLWITNALLILLVLFIVGVGVILALRESPLLYRQTAAKIKLAETVLSTRINSLGGWNTDRAQRLLQSEAENRQLRFLILDMDGQILQDLNENAPNSKLEGFMLPDETSGDSEENVLAVEMSRDQHERTWLYSVVQLESGDYLVVADRRPVVLLRNVLTDDTLRPFLQAGLAALFLSILIGLLISGWVAAPLKRMAEGARRLADGQFEPIKPEGPTEVRQLAETLNEMAGQVQLGQQTQRDFIANVTHELKTPLTSIQGFSQALLDGTVQDERGVQQAAQVINSEAERMNRLVLDLLALARLEAGIADLSFAPVDLAALLGRIAQQFSLLAGQAQVDLRANIPSLPMVYGDGDRLAQVFTNLVDNALKYSSAGGTVNIAAIAQPGKVRVSVMDTGPGIAAEELSRVFERFYQVDKSRRSTKGRGVGLGLPIARQIVQAHDGKIWVESTLGKGSIFYVEIPCNDHRTLQK